MIYIPEVDHGRSLGTHPIMSANMWLPKSRVKNVGAFIRATTVATVNSRTGNDINIPLAQEADNCVVVARHLFTDDEWERRVGAFEKIDLSSSWERVDFNEKAAPRDSEQVLAWSAFQEVNNGVLNLSCGKGKTFLAIKKIAERGYPAIAIVHNESIMLQWIESFKRFLGVSDNDIGIVKGEKAQWDRPLVVGMIQTLANRVESDVIPQNVRARFGTIVFDEVHHLAASKFVLVAPLFYGNRYGLSATPDREDGLQDVYFAHIGEVFYSDLTSYLEADVFFKQMWTPTPSDKRAFVDRAQEFSVAKLHKYLSHVPERNGAILNHCADALDVGRKILLLTHQKEHVALLAQAAATYPRLTERKIGAATGETAGPERARIIKESDLTFATLAIAVEGLDVVELDTVIFATPLKAWAPFQQGKGRAERKLKGKKRPVVIVLEDNLIGPAFGMCRALKKRMKDHGVKFTTLK